MPSFPYLRQRSCVGRHRYCLLTAPNQCENLKDSQGGGDTAAGQEGEEQQRPMLRDALR